MTPLLVMNLGFAWGTGAPIVNAAQTYLTIGIGIAIRCLLLCAIGGAW